MYRLILITIITLTLVSGNVFDRTLKTSSRLEESTINGIMPKMNSLCSTTDEVHIYNMYIFPILSMLSKR